MAKRRKRQKQIPDLMLLAAVATLLSLGLAMLFSAGVLNGNNPYAFIRRQLMWTVVGLAVLVFMGWVDFAVWRRWALPLLGLTILALVGVRFFGTATFGSTRTFLHGSVQPSEAAKLALVIYIAAWMTSKGDRLKDIQEGLIPFGILIGLTAGLVAIQPDVSTAFIITATAIAMFFIAGATWGQIGILMAVVAGAFTILITRYQHTASRMHDYLAHLKDPMSSNQFQVKQNLTALLRGKLTGRLVDLPHQHALSLSWNDNIFALLGQELGLLGSLMVLGLFAFLAYRGFHIALQSEDRFGSLLAVGITSWLTIQAALNIAVVTAVAPVTGVTLPFLSFGGSSLVASMAGIGLLLSVSRGTTSDVTVRKKSSAGGRRQRRTRVSTVSSTKRVPRRPSVRRTNTRRR